MRNRFRYNIIEYHNTNTQSDTTMFYDANGNLIRDLDRGITAIKYNILNLPDTIQFINGNQIVNLYDASGHKYKSIAYTIIPTTVTAHYEVEHYTFDTDTVEYLVKEYTGNTELCYTPTDTLSQRIFNSIGYNADGIYYHYIKDHLGNICAVVHSATDTLVQNTMYYASGVPMSQSYGRDRQPYLYNGKEFVEAHGLNTYDYGFRGYYAPIGRFTSIDPLAEQTPWQSPYSYAGNRFVNAIDYMGLMQVLNWCAVDGNGNVKGWGLNGDYFVYEVDGDWDGSYEGLSEDDIIGLEIPGMQAYYKKGQPTYYIGLGGGGGSNKLSGRGTISGQLIYGKKPVTETVNTTIGALWHYFTGEGEVAQNGNWSKLMFGTQSEFLSILLSTYILGKKEGHGKIDMEFVFSQFHIGDTFYDYYVTDNMLVISFGLGDGFRDANFVFEILGIVGQKLGINTPDAWAADRLGSNLELPGGVPFNYAPSFIILPFYGD